MCAGSGSAVVLLRAEGEGGACCGEGGMEHDGTALVKFGCISAHVYSERNTEVAKMRSRFTNKLFPPKVSAQRSNRRRWDLLS